MSGPDWCRWYAGKWLTGTFGLSLEQKGFYDTVINVILDRGECMADMRWIAHLCGCNAQRARRLVEELKVLGKLTETDGKLGQNRAQSERELATKLAKIGQDLARKRWPNNDIVYAAQQYQPQPQKNKKDSEGRSLEEKTEQIPPNGHDRAAKPGLSAGFDSWWLLWTIPGTKRGKGTAQRAYTTARKIASIEILDERLKTQVRRWRSERTELQFIPHPATWLNGKRWEDDLLAGPTPAATRRQFIDLTNYEEPTL